MGENRTLFRIGDVKEKGDVIMTKFYISRKGGYINFIKVQKLKNKYYVTWYNFKNQYVKTHDYSVCDSIREMAIAVVQRLF